MCAPGGDAYRHTLSHATLQAPCRHRAVPGGDICPLPTCRSCCRHSSGMGPVRCTPRQGFDPRFGNLPCTLLGLREVQDGRRASGGARKAARCLFIWLSRARAVAQRRLRASHRPPPRLGGETAGVQTGGSAAAACELLPAHAQGAARAHRPAPPRTK